MSEEKIPARLSPREIHVLAIESDFSMRIKELEKQAEARGYRKAVKEIFDYLKNGEHNINNFEFGLAADCIKERFGVK